MVVLANQSIIPAPKLSEIIFFKYKRPIIAGAGKIQIPNVLFILF